MYILRVEMRALEDKRHTYIHTYIHTYMYILRVEMRALEDKRLGKRVVKMDAKMLRREAERMVHEQKAAIDP
jgi:hypothetical protein